MTIKIEATSHELEKIETLARMVDTVLDGGDFPSWRDVMYEVQEILAQAETREAKPLIKDDETRQTIKAWAKVNDIAKVLVTVTEDAEGVCPYWELENIVWGRPMAICFGGKLPDTLEDTGVYTIEELCGESQDDANM